ncbi:hypothetical protein FSP39_015055 [Pinctada imbricata]|uniref:NACHT domain-containing protein n=1 Tax=Pinctada imbricata TaxID=66713 RepID=A0AA88XL90_PINIB|nr:hypothetical protein FSP39_015055 [Pinctada imbricata]
MLETQMKANHEEMVQSLRKLKKSKETTDQSSQTSPIIKRIEGNKKSSNLPRGQIEINREDHGDNDTRPFQSPKLLYSNQDVILYSRDEEPEIRRLKQRLLEKNKYETKVVPLSALQERGRELPIELLLAQVIIRDDHTYGEMGRSYSHLKREVNDPNDIFVMNGKEVRNVYMLGDAAHGKTTFCIWLVRNWCNAQHGCIQEIEILDKWETSLKIYDFVFLLKFRNVNPNRASVVDMICQDVFGIDKGYHATIRHILSSDKYRSLIIMDGLDEWNPNDEARKQLTCQGMPNIEDLASTVTCFFSMRPWTFAAISKMVKMNDRVVEICGLSESGMKIVMKNVLLNYYHLNYSSVKYNDVFKRMKMNLKQNTLKSFMQIPLLAVVCVQIWYEGKQVGDSLTSFYASMLDMLIERGSYKHDLQIINESDCELPDILSEHENIKKMYSVLLKFGKVAYEGLLSNEINLVFQKRKLEKEIGVTELQFALDIGLISQKEAPSLLTKNVSVHFFHKSLQEFLAVIYIVTNKEVGDSFCEHLSRVEVIMELSNVIMFICGMCPSFGSIISQHVVSVTDSDIEICEYRRSLELGNTTVEELYKLQVSWYRELQDRKTGSPVTFHVSDVYVRDSSDMETVKLTRELLSDPHVADIRSLSLDRVPTNVGSGITCNELNDFLTNTDHTRSLTMVYIDGKYTFRSIRTICIPSLVTLYLGYVTIDKTCLDTSVRSQLLSNVSSLRKLWLVGLTVCDGEFLDLSPDMIKIERLTLLNLHMTAEDWGKFIWTLLDYHHILDCKLVSTNIDDESVGIITSNARFEISQESNYVRFTRLRSVSNGMAIDEEILHCIDDNIEEEEEEDEEEESHLQDGQFSNIPHINGCKVTENQRSKGSGLVKPVFMSEREGLESETKISSKRITRQEIFLAMNDLVTADHIRGIERTGKLWRLHVETNDDRNTLLTSGINIRSKHVSLMPENPRKKRRRRDTTTTLKVFDVPLSVDDQRIKGSIEREGCVVLDLYREKLKVKTGRENLPSSSTNCDTGTRIIIVRKLKSHLPRILSVGKHTASIRYDGQPNYEGALSRHSYEIENDSDSDESNMIARQTKGFLSLCCCFSRNDDTNSDENADITS